MKSLKNRYILSFFITLIIVIPLFKYVVEFNWIKAILVGVVFSIFNNYFQFLFFKTRYPMYLKAESYKDVIQEMKAIGVIQLKEKGEKSVYKIVEEKWPNNKIRMIHRPYSLFIEVPEKYHSLFAQYINENI